MGKAHFLIFCDRELVDNAMQLFVESDATIEIVSRTVLVGERIEDTTEVYELRRGHEQASVSIVVGDLESRVGPYDGEYWITVQGEPQGFFRCNEPFARELTEILTANGGRKTRKKRGDQVQ
jgi:hypothetical protein